ncbi:TPA: HNH endonuclease, partial [Enterococcus faecium]|nr:HNH endonuclease [Enterococcus faecium]HAQ0018054.1 HNH endonuclease [Enterococcus faecium]
MTEEFYRWLLQLIREDRLVKFYQSPKWRRLREKAMKRDHYECQECRRLGKYHRVENV